MTGSKAEKDRKGDTTPANQAKFLTGAPMRHVVVMTSTASIGLMSIFAVDLVDMYFLSLLGEPELAAAVGFGGTILFFTTSVSIGVAISMAALVARRIGAGDEEAAKGTVTNVFAVSIALTVPIAIVVWVQIPALLDLLGARERVAELATAYLRIIIPTLPFLTIGMACGGALRGTGDARRAMNTTVAAGVVNAVLDPILIFGLDLGIEGAAWASVAARLTVMLVGLHGVVKVRGMIAPFSRTTLLADLRPIFSIAGPAILTQVATPVGNAYVTASIAAFGTSAVAGYSVIGRLLPVAFGVVFALSGAVGPIIGQNSGAGRSDRVKRTLIDAIVFAGLFCAAIWIILIVCRHLIVDTFGLQGEAAQLVILFCTTLSILFTFNGWFFVANATFNNLGRATWATAANWGRNTLGTIPFVAVGAWLAGAKGVLLGQAVGAVAVGILTTWVAWRLVSNLGADGLPHPAPVQSRFFRIPIPDLTAARGWIGISTKD